VGPNAVMVSSIPDGGPATRPLGAANDKSNPSTRFARPAPRAGAQLAAQQSEVPSQYGDATHPLLSFTLLEGDNPLEINLTSNPSSPPPTIAH
jgi:hypothetical protein